MKGLSEHQVDHTEMKAITTSFKEIHTDCLCYKLKKKIWSYKWMAKHDLNCNKIQFNVYTQSTNPNQESYKAVAMSLAK